jgi:hypothetical protein
VFLEYATGAAAEKARLALHGREFGETPIAAELISQEAFAAVKAGQAQPAAAAAGGDAE